MPNDAVTPSQSKAHTLLKALYEKTKDQNFPVDDITTLETADAARNHAR
jgi:hypothetical protein